MLLSTKSWELHETRITPGAPVARALLVAMPELGDTRVRYRGIYGLQVWSKMFGTADIATGRAILDRFKEGLATASAVEFTFDLNDQGVLTYEYVTSPFVVCKRGEQVYADS